MDNLSRRAAGRAALVSAAGICLVALSQAALIDPAQCNSPALRRADARLQLSANSGSSDVDREFRPFFRDARELKPECAREIRPQGRVLDAEVSPSVALFNRNIQAASN